MRAALKMAMAACVVIICATALPYPPATQSAPVYGFGLSFYADGTEAVGFRADVARTGVFPSTVPPNATTVLNFSAGIEAVTTPCYWNGTLLFGDSNGMFHAVGAADAKELWNFSINGQDEYYLIESSAQVAGGMVYFGAGNGCLYCLHASNGTFAWKFRCGGEIRSSPLIVGGLAIFGATDGIVYAVDVTTHMERWNRSTGGEIWGSASYSSGRVFIGSLDGQMRAYNLTGGQELWHARPTPNVDTAIYSTPAVVNGTLYFGFGANGPGGVAAMDASSGNLTWLFGVDSPLYNGSYYSSVSVHGERLYAQRNLAAPYGPGASLFAISAVDRNGDKVISGASEVFWKYDTGENNGGSSPAVADGKVLVGCDNGKRSALFCINEGNGTLAWSVPSLKGIYGSPCAAGGIVTVVNRGGTLFIVSPAGLKRMAVQIAPETTLMRANQVISMKFYVNQTAGGAGVEAAMLRVKASAGKLSQEVATTFQDGTQTIKFWAPDTKVNLTISISGSAAKSGYADASAELTVRVRTVAVSIADSQVSVNWARYTMYFAAVAVLAGLTLAALVASAILKKRLKNGGGGPGGS